MSLIPCDDDCVYQQDGYCALETPAVVTNHSGGCLHYVKAGKQPKNLPEAANSTNRSTLQTPL